MDALSGLSDMHFIYVCTKLAADGEDDDTEADVSGGLGTVTGGAKGQRTSEEPPEHSAAGRS